MIQVVSNIAPIFLIIVIGYGFKRTGFPGDGFWAPAERLSYFVLLPALIIHSLASADLGGLQIWPLASTILLLSAGMTLLAVVLKPILRIDGPGFTSVLQGSVRLNAYIGFAIAATFFGPVGLTITAVFIAIMMPTVNVISIAALAVYGSGNGKSWLRIPVQIITNPLILACAAGAALNVLDAPRPDWVMGMLDILGKSALPLALLCVGAGLDLSIGRARTGAMVTTCALKLLVMPALAWAIVGATGLTGLAASVTLMMAATPSSPATYVMARQLGGDAELMASIVTLENAFAAITLSAVLAWRTGVTLF